MRGALIVMVVATVTATAGCSGSPEPTAPSDPPASSATPPTAPSTAGSPSSSASASGAPITPASGCLDGRYRLARFVGVGADKAYGTGQGGDVTVTFDNGKYEMTGAGKEPITVTLASQSAPLTVDGTVEGVYSGKGEKVNFTRGKATGSATVTAGNAKRTLTMAQIASVLAPSGDGKLTCTADQLTITLKTVRLELEH